ncbi:MAG: PAS domain S-box protein [bacterium]
MPERLFRTVFEAAPSAMIVVASDGRVLLVNSQAERLFGWSRVELVGRPVEDLIPERCRAEHLRHREGFLAAPQARPMGAGRDLYGLRRDGGEVPIEIGLTPLPREDGVFVLASIIDITERKRAAERLMLAVEAAPSAMLLVAADGRITLMNSQVEQVFGWPRDEILGESIEVLVPERFRVSHPDQRREFFATPSMRPMGAGRDLNGLRRDGTEIPVEIGLNPIHTPDGLFVLASVIDITQRKLSERALRASLAEKEALLKEIHHRVKNNLQLVSSLLNLQARKVNDPQLRAVFREVHDRVRAMSLVHQKLYQSANVSQVGAEDYLRSLVGLVAHGYAPVAPHVSTVIGADDIVLTPDIALPLGLIVNELVSNAFKHAFPAGRPGTIGVDLRRRGERHFVLMVCDDGVGMPAGVDVSQSQSLGLRLVGYMLEQLGGGMDVVVDGGTRIAVRCALDRAEPGRSGEP